ncbi:hypothetical protein MMC12_001765 [Toensbergia leucococca]|nr:hypothetical protein [Toensbergia leucococca]
MFLLPWSTAARNEKVRAEKIKLSATKQQRPPVVQIPLLNKMKRKREKSEDSEIFRPDRTPAKRQPNPMSHGRATNNEDIGVVAPSDGQQGNGYENVAVPPEQANPDSIKHDQEQTEQSINPTFSSTSPTPTSSMQRRPETEPQAPEAVNLTALQMVIESQFSLEILLKHKELRLIEQETAKCQAALEQLRRCQIIPYPALSSNYEDMLGVSSGSGPVLQGGMGHLEVPDSAPWGVVDGPYTRHYAKWLIPDSRFDGSTAEDAQTSHAAGKRAPGRATRGSKAGKGLPAGKSRSKRGTASGNSQALPHEQAESKDVKDAKEKEAKEEKGPMILKRSTDGRMVKLVCLDCRRTDFGSVQGFINHCRISHNRGFASHEAAALACGEEVELNEAGGIIGEPSGATSMSAALVHPLIRSMSMSKLGLKNVATILPRRESLTMGGSSNQQPKPPQLGAAISTTFPENGHTPEPRTTRSTSFTPSTQTPHLSAMFARSGLGGDLDDMVTQATMTTPGLDAQEASEDDEDDIDMEDAPETSNPQNLTTRGVLRGGRLPARATMSPAPVDRPPSRKGTNSSRKPEYLKTIIPRTVYSSPYALSTCSPHTQQDFLLLDTPRAMNLSPNTLESNPAPSLVSDDGDYENTHSDPDSPSSASASDEEDRFLDVEVEDHDDSIGLGASSNAQPTEIVTAPKAHPATAERRSSALRGRTALRPEERHVLFTSPIRRIGSGGLKKGSRRRN